MLRVHTQKILSRNFLTCINERFFQKTFSPVSRNKFISTKDSFTQHVKTAFLNSELDKTIYMVQPPHFETKDPNGMVCQLKKSIYGLKQASRQWYFKFAQVIISFGFEANQIDECIYHKFSGSKVMFLVLYVDDLLLATNDMNMLRETKEFLYEFFEMKDLGEASYVFGLKIHRHCSQSILGFSQQVYIDKVLKRYDMKQCKPGDTPMVKGRQV
jgi:Reverse transcriptase (RNA-dependent DNA polymerase)